MKKIVLNVPGMLGAARAVVELASSSNPIYDWCWYYGKTELLDRNYFFSAHKLNAV